MNQQRLSMEGQQLRNRKTKNASLFHLRPNKKFTLCLSMYGILMSNLKHTQSRTHDLYERLFVDAKYADKGLAGGENRPCRCQPRDEQMRGFDCYLLPQRQPLLFYLLGIYLCARLQNSIYAILHAAFQVKRDSRVHIFGQKVIGIQPQSSCLVTSTPSSPHLLPSVRCNMCGEHVLRAHLNK